MEEEKHEKCFDRVIKAHQRVVDTWHMNQSEKLKKLVSIAEMHTQNALYRPLVFTEDVEEEFYEDVDDKSGVLCESRPPFALGYLISRLRDE